MQIRERFVRSLAEHIATHGGFEPLPGAVELLRQLRASATTPVALATGGWRESAKLKLRSAGFDTEHIVLATGSDALARADIMRIALGQLGDSIESVTYYGDAEWDREACRELGWEFVAVGERLDGLRSFAGLGAQI